MTNNVVSQNQETVNRIVGQLGAIILALVEQVVEKKLAKPADDIVADNAPGLPVSPAKARQLCKSGEIESTKRGRRWFFRRADLMAYLSPERLPVASNDVAPAADPVDELAGKLGLRIGGRR